MLRVEQELRATKMLSEETLSRLKAVQEQVAIEKKRVRQFLIETRERREKEEGTPVLTPGLSSSSNAVHSIHDSLAPRLAAAIGVEEKSPRQVEEQDDASESNEDEDEFDMFNTSSPTPKKRKIGNDTAARKKVAIAAAELRAVDSYDDAEGYYRPEVGEFLDGRYKVLSGLCGKGVFSSVLRCIDSEPSQDENAEVAVKVVRANHLMRKAGEKEVEILRKLNAGDKERKKHVVRLLRVFDHRNHLCLVFEALSLNLRSVLKTYGHGKGLNLQLVIIYAKQLMVALKHMKRMELIHADIKPDNILANSDLNVVKICDLGSACEISDNEITDYLVSRYYRAPEVILGCRYGYAIDMWSMACTLYELAVGSILFTGRDNNNMLYQIMQLRGRFPNKLLKAGTLTGKHFSDDFLEFRWNEYDRKTSQVTVKAISPPAKPVKQIYDLLSSKLPVLQNAAGEPPQSAFRVKAKQFADFLDRSLMLDPAKRLTPEEALQHPFLKQSMAELSSSFV